jgi:hypothetical protein
METVNVDRDFLYRKCKVCGKEERLPRAGKIRRGISIEAETFRDFERREFAKEHLQAHEPDGSVNELFEEAYGDPVERGKSRMGKGVDQYQIKDKKGSKSKLSKQQIRKAREKMKARAGKA